MSKQLKEALIAGVVVAVVQYFYSLYTDGGSLHNTGSLLIQIGVILVAAVVVYVIAKRHQEK
ncbi:MAG: hypothetical protein Q4A55_01095 [Aerococcus sp.]|nr:hypothetical protein [Aerococcus sp.]